MEKCCSKCSETKPVEEFNKNSNAKDGLQSWCRECSLEATRAWRAANGDRGRAATKAWSKAHPEQRREAAARLRAADPTKHRGYSAKWRAANPDVQEAATQRWREANIDRVRATRRAGNVRRRARLANVLNIPFTVDQLAQRWAYYGNKCWVCADHVATETDHVKPISKGGAHILANLRPICKPCNLAKNATWPYPLGNAA